MPLVKCPTCEKDVSDKAPACPHCGEPMRTSVEVAQGGAVNPKDPVHFVGLLICGFILLGVVIYALQLL